MPFTLIKAAFSNEGNRNTKIGTTLPRWGNHGIKQAAESQAFEGCTLPIFKQLQWQSQVNNVIQFHLNACFAISHVVIPMKRSQIIKLIGGEENVVDFLIGLAIKLIMSR